MVASWRRSAPAVGGRETRIEEQRSEVEDVELAQTFGKLPSQP
jgi:hypothetical protein